MAYQRRIIFITGASGSGKTSTLKKIEINGKNLYHFCYFDHFGVPSESEVLKEFGGWENWQKTIAHKWLDIIEKQSDELPTLFEGQLPPAYIEQLCREREINNYSVILIDCSEDERRYRLIQRKQPGLANKHMMNWARFLRSETEKRGWEIVDNTKLNENEGLVALEETLKRLT
ncbi:MAG TPA: hypothetical protein VIR98_01045 [Candidatus Paceibacterota bacterium]|jgi:hypothetical protein